MVLLFHAQLLDAFGFRFLILVLLALGRGLLPAIVVKVVFGCLVDHCVLARAFLVELDLLHHKM